jgi:hypothetical protein
MTPFTAMKFALYRRGTTGSPMPVLWVPRLRDRCFGFRWSDASRRDFASVAVAVLGDLFSTTPSTPPGQSSLDGVW